MTILRIINVIVWSALFLYMLPGAWSASFGKEQRHGDPMRLAVLATAFIIAGFCIRWLIAPTSDLMWAALYILSALDGVFIFRLAKAYGRGPRLG